MRRTGVAAAAARLRERMAAIATAVAPAAAPADGGVPSTTAERTRLHDLRVACRRLETALRLWARGADAREARRRARAMRRAGGPAREHEVLCALLRARRLGAAAVPPELRQVWLAELAGTAQPTRRSAFPTARAVARLAARVERVVPGLDHAAGLDARANERLARWRRAGRSRLAAALASGEAEALHRARIALKRWRYAEEERAAFARDRGLAAEPPASALRRWQRALGELNDRALLIEYARASGPRGRRLVPRLEALRHAAVERLHRHRDGQP